MRVRLWVALSVGLCAGFAPAQVIDSCTLNDDRCYRAALELRDAWDRCSVPRFVVDQTAWSSGSERLQGVWCEWVGQGGNGIFHSAPVAWPWVAATSSHSRAARTLPMQAPHSLIAYLPFIANRVFADGQPLATLVQKRLLSDRSRLAGALLVLVDGNDVVVVERFPSGGDVRPEDLPFGLVPWRPVWIFLPQLSEAERAILREATVHFIVRTTDPQKCLVNEISGERLLAEGPAEQDATVSNRVCSALAEKIKGLKIGTLDESLFRASRGGPTVRDAIVEALLAPTEAPAFVRTGKPNVDSLEVPAKSLP